MTDHEPASPLQVISCLAGLVMFIVLLALFFKPDAKNPMPGLNPATPVRPAETRKQTEAEIITALMQAARDNDRNPEKRLEALQRLSKLAVSRKDTIALLLDAIETLPDSGEGGPRKDCYRLLSSYGREGAAAYLQRNHHRRETTNNRLDSDFHEAVTTLIDNSPEDILDALLAHPDRVALFTICLNRSYSSATASPAGIERATRHADPLIRLAALHSQYPSVNVFNRNVGPHLSPQSLVRTALERLKADDSDEVRTLAVCILGWQHKEPAAGVLPALRKALADPSPQVRLATAWALGVKHGREREAAAKALAEIAQGLRVAPSRKGYSDDLPRRQAANAVGLLAVFGSPYQDRIFPLLRELAGKRTSYYDNSFVFYCFAPACPGLLPLVLQRNGTEQDVLLARRLADHHPSEAVAVAEEHLKAPSPKLRWLALDLLARSDPARARKAAPGLAPLFRDRSRPPAPRLVEDHPDLSLDFPLNLGPTPLPALDWTRAAKLAPTEEDIPWLLTAVQGGGTSALPVLARLGPRLKPILAELVAWQPPADAVEEYRRVLLAAGAEAGPLVLAQFQKNMPAGQETILLPVLVKCVDDTPGARPVLEKWIADHRKDTKVGEAIAKSSVGLDPLLMPIWIEQLRGSGENQWRAKDYFGRQGPEASPLVPELVKLLRSLAGEKEPPAGTAASVAEILGRIGPKARDAVPELIALFAQDDLARRHAITACTRVGTAAVPELVQALGSKKPLVRAGAAETLGKIGPAAKEEAVPQLLRLEKVERNEGVRESVRQALKRLEPME